MTEFKGPIVEGAYYEREDGKFVGPARRDGTWWQVGGHSYDDDGAELWATAGAGYALRLTRRVYITHTDPAEVVAKLEAEADAIGGHGSDYDNGIYVGYVNAARIAGELLGVEQVRAAVKEWVSQCPESDEYQLKELRAKVAEVVAELTARSDAAYAKQTAYDGGYHQAVSNAYESAADLVTEKLGVKS